MAIEPLKLPSHPAPAPEARVSLPQREPRTVTPTVPEVELPPAPDPVEVVEAASRRNMEMQERGRELHFSRTDTGLRIEVYDGLGRLVQEIPPNERMARAAGRSAWRA